MANERPFMPVETLVEEVCDDGADYSDGDHPGWFAGQWNPNTQELLLRYQEDDSDDLEEKFRSPYRSTEHVFRLGAQARVGDQSDPALIERLCEVMHNAYEAAAVGAGWSTQEASRKPWADVPEANRVTMRASVRAVLTYLQTGAAPTSN